MNPINLLETVRNFNQIVLKNAENDTPLMRETALQITNWACDSIDEIMDYSKDEYDERVKEFQLSLEDMLNTLDINPEEWKAMNEKINSDETLFYEENEPDDLGKNNIFKNNDFNP